MIKGLNVRFNKQSGAALVVALVMIVVLTLIGLASTFTSTFESKLSGHKRESTSAFFTADAGLEAAKANETIFDLEITNYADRDASIPNNLSNEPIDMLLTNPNLDLPAGANFTVPPAVVVYHLRVPGDGQMYLRSERWIIDSIGRDQLTGFNPWASRTHVREKRLVRDRGKNREMEN